MKIGDPLTAPQAQHGPLQLVKFHYEGGGDGLSDADAYAYGTSGASLDGAHCATCQRREGAEMSRYARLMKLRYKL
jgi:hypothetical protein